MVGFVAVILTLILIKISKKQFWPIDCKKKLNEDIYRSLGIRTGSTDSTSEEINF